MKCFRSEEHTGTQRKWYVFEGCTWVKIRQTVDCYYSIYCTSCTVYERIMCIQGSGNTYRRLLFSVFRTCGWLPGIPKTPWLVFGSFQQSDCGFGNRRMHFIPLRYYTGVNVSIPVVHRYFTVCKNCLINTDSGAFSVDRLPYCSTLATLPSDLHARNSYSRAVLWKYRRKMTTVKTRYSVTPPSRLTV
jgi:hypothetical protein